MTDRADITCNALIIGGGIHGTCATGELAKAGLEVALVEQGSIGGGATGTSSGILNNGLVFFENGATSLSRLLADPQRLV